MSLRTIALVTAASTVAGSRFNRRKGLQGTQTKWVGDVPILNYQEVVKQLQNVGEEEIGLMWNFLLKPSATDDSIDDICQGRCQLMGNPSEGGVPFLSVRAREDELADLVTGEVSFIEPNTQYTLPPMESFEVEPSAETAPWGLERVGVKLRGGQGQGVNIFVLDTGVRTTHVDFGGRAASAVDVTSGSVVECKGSLTCARDGQGHGTHCAGSAAGTKYGVASKATIRSGKVLSDSGSGDFMWLFGALDWVATKGARPAVASMSLGGQGVLAACEVAVDAATKAGVVVVLASGNSNADACGFSPAFVPSAITVGSSNNVDWRSLFSNYGKCVNIYAPGSRILSAGIASDTASTTLDGTSMACPHVSGGAALVLERTPTKTPPQVLSELLANASSGYLRSLMPGDPNKLLWVGAGGAPAEVVPGSCPMYCYMCVLPVCKSNCNFCQA